MKIKWFVLAFILSAGCFVVGHEASANSIRSTRLAADDVLSTLSPYLESKFDTIIIANTATGGTAQDLVPFQHARVLIKKSSSQALFKRNSAGDIIGFNESNITTLQDLPQYVPISSGVAGDGGIKTFSGIFRINLTRSKSHLSTSKEAAMSYAVYVDAHYGSKPSGVAIHGTPTKNHKLLGVQRASHGCLRTYPKYAQLIYQYLIKDAKSLSDGLPAFDRYQNLPSEIVQAGGLGEASGVNALFIIFNGYDAEKAAH